MLGSRARTRESGGTHGAFGVVRTLTSDPASGDWEKGLGRGMSREASSRPLGARALPSSRGASEGPMIPTVSIMQTTRTFSAREGLAGGGGGGSLQRGGPRPPSSPGSPGRVPGMPHGAAWRPGITRPGHSSHMLLMWTLLKGGSSAASCLPVRGGGCGRPGCTLPALPPAQVSSVWLSGCGFGSQWPPAPLLREPGDPCTARGWGGPEMIP